jgi:Uma2 family endonuclease
MECRWTSSEPLLVGIDVDDRVDTTALPGETAFMGQAAVRSQLSPEEYLAFERASELRHEYADGEIFVRAGSTYEHSLIAANIIGELSLALEDRPCRVLTSDMRIKIQATGRYVYPDASVVCGSSIYEDATRDTLLNPVVVIEVLSDSSEAYDRGDKFAQYRSIESLKEYVLASQKEARIEHFRRLPDGSWLLRIYQRGDRVGLESLGVELSVDRAYLKVFDPPVAEG